MLEIWIFDRIFGRRINPKAETEKELVARYGPDWHRYDGTIHWVVLR